MADELLQKEKEYHELNKKLELRTKELLQEVDDVMKYQDSLIDYTFDQRKYSLEDERKCYKSNGIKKSASTIKLNSNECKELNVPEDANNMGTKALVQFLKAKLKGLQFDHDRQIIEYKTKCDEVRKLQKENQSLISEREKWLQTANSARVLNNKFENQMKILQSKLQTKENENNVLKREAEQLKKDVKSGRMHVSNVEVRMNRNAEENEKLKSSLKVSKLNEKDLREAHRNQLAEMTNALKRIEKDKCDLLNAFKKQMLLIDNLKRQKVLLETVKITEKNECDFMKLLNWQDETS